MVQVRKASKRNAKVRLALTGPAGSGKTMTALITAKELAQGGKILVLDSEHGSSEKYADKFDFDIVELSNFHPQKYIEVINYAQTEDYTVLVIDSLSHAWAGVGGVLDLAEQGAARENKNTFAGWKHATPHQNALIEAILGARLHVIATMRVKTDYLVEKYNDGNRDRQRVTKVGLAPVQKETVEYEFDIVANLDVDNNLVISKTRCSALNGAVIQNPDKHFAQTILNWLTGEPNPDELLVTEYKTRYEAATSLIQLNELTTEIKAMNLPDDSWLRKQLLNLHALAKQRIDAAQSQTQNEVN